MIQKSNIKFTIAATTFMKNTSFAIVSEFKKIHLGNWVLRDESNDEVNFVIRDLENFSGLQHIL